MTSVEDCIDCLDTIIAIIRCSSKPLRSAFVEICAISGGYTNRRTRLLHYARASIEHCIRKVYATICVQVPPMSVQHGNTAKALGAGCTDVP